MTKRSKNVSKGTTHQGLNVIKPEPTEAQLIALGRAALKWKEADRIAEAERIARQAAIDAEGIQLRGERLSQAQRIAARVHFVGMSIHRMAHDAGNSLDITESEWNLIAIEELAKNVTRLADVMAELVGSARVGNWDDELKPVKDAA